MNTAARHWPLSHVVVPAWRRLRPVECWSLAASTVVAAGLLMGLVQACETSVRRGEQLRAQQALAIVAPQLKVPGDALPVSIDVAKVDLPLH